MERDVFVGWRRVVWILFRGEEREWWGLGA